MATTKGTPYYIGDDKYLPIEQDGVRFDIKNPDEVHKLKDRASVANSISMDGEAGLKYSVNIIDIDWDNAEIDKKHLSTTGEFINNINLLFEILKNI